MESIYLHGSEDVKNAAYRMEQAAAEMNRAASYMDEILTRFIRDLREIEAERDALAQERT